MPVHHLTDAELIPLADELRAGLPVLDPDEQRIAVALYRLLAEGTPVAEPRVAEAVALAPERVAATLRGWPGIFRDERGEIVGFWGLAQQEFPPHQLHVDGRRLWGWCAWDTLFLPIVLGRTARIESVDAITGEPVRAVVGPHGVEEASDRALISFVRTNGAFDQDVIANFCHHVLFFASTKAAARWIGDRDDAFLLTLAQGFELGRRVWEAKFAAALAAETAAA